jgi:hypothetical protein
VWVKRVRWNTGTWVCVDVHKSAWVGMGVRVCVGGVGSRVCGCMGTWERWMCRCERVIRRVCGCEWERGYVATRLRTVSVAVIPVRSGT